MNKTLVTLFFTLSINYLSFAQVDLFDYYDAKQMQYDNDVYLPFIKSVRLFPNKDPLAPPIIRLGGSPLRLVFDDITAEFHNYGYTVVHCNADWTPSDLLKAEYIDGFQEYFIREHEFAFNTFVPYVSYSFTIPNQYMRLTKSGNSLLIIFENDDPEQVVITRRFMVYEDFVTPAIAPKRATLTQNMDTHQEINFIINHTGYTIPDPMQDLKVAILQNQRWDNAILNLKPQFVGNSTLTYNYDEENNFPGGNEFRFFDVKNFQTLTMNVRRYLMDSIWEAVLVPMRPRETENYSVQPDVNGNYVIRRTGARNPEIEADYCWVDFFLASSTVYEEGNVYVFGALSDWKIRPEFLLRYDYKRMGYTGKILLKQGYYDFKFAIARDGINRADETLIEGSHWETENDYTVLIYHREIGIRYDRLIGFATVNYQGIQ